MALSFPYIRAWKLEGRTVCPYGQREATKAAQDKAPSDAIYRRADGTYATLKDINNPELRARIEAAGKKLAMEHDE